MLLDGNHALLGGCISTHLGLLQPVDNPELWAGVVVGFACFRLASSLMRISLTHSFSHLA